MTKTIKLSQPLDVLHLAFGRSNSALKRRTASTCLPATLRPRLPAAHTFCTFSFQVSAAHFRGAFKNIHYIVCVVARLCAQWYWNLSSGGKCDSRDETCTVLKNNVEAFYTSVSVFHNFTTWWRQILYFSLHHIYEITLVTCYFVDYIRTKEEEKKLILKKLKNAEYQSWYQLPISCSQVYSIYIYTYYQKSTWTCVHLTSDTLRLDTWTIFKCYPVLKGDFHFFNVSTKIFICIPVWLLDSLYTTD